MNEILKEIKKNIETLVNEYDIKGFSVYIDDGINIENINGSKPLEKEIIIEIEI